MRKKTGSNILCATCSKEYYVSKCNLGKSKYCSVKCFDIAQTTAEVFKYKCRRCDTVFHAKKDHGNHRKYCSRACSDGDAVQQRDKECPSCGGVFFAKRSDKTPDGLRKYCSSSCRDKGKRSGERRNCLECGSEFYIQTSKAKPRPRGSCCSSACQSIYYTRERQANWSGGIYIDERTNMLRCYIGKTKYKAEHRIIAERIIKRKLLRTEPILHINHDNLDNKPENLFICSSLSEMSRILNNSLPYPQTSNLGLFK